MTNDECRPATLLLANHRWFSPRGTSEEMPLAALVHPVLFDLFDAMNHVPSTITYLSCILWKTKVLCSQCYWLVPIWIPPLWSELVLQCSPSLQWTPMKNLFARRFCPPFSPKCVNTKSCVSSKHWQTPHTASSAQKFSWSLPATSTCAKLYKLRSIITTSHPLFYNQSLWR